MAVELMGSAEEFVVEVMGRQLAARRWHREAGYPTLALHGWRDNCASYDFLAPQLTASDVVAVDLAGQGHSDFRSADAPYTIWQDIGELLALADQLGWQQFDLIGHSRGAAVATLLAASHPGRVRRLVLIEGLFPVPAEIEEAPQLLARAVADHRRLTGRPVRRYPSFDKAVAARQRGPLALSDSAAGALARRGLDDDEAGWFWRLDPRLAAASEVKFSREFGEVFIRRLACPVLLLLGDQSPFRLMPYVRELAALNPRIQWQEVPGGHHCHMVPEPDINGVAYHIQRFLQP